MSMFKCNRCGILKEELPTVEERYPHGETYASKYFADDSCGCGGEFEKAIQCDKCYEWCLDEELVGFEHKICEECKESIFEEISMKDFINGNSELLEEFVDFAMKGSNVNV